MRISRKKRLEIIRSVREVQGLNWTLPIARQPREQREAQLKPIIAATEDKKTRKALEAIMIYGRDGLTEITGSPGNFRRLFIWDWFENYMQSNGYNDHSKPSRSLKRASEAVAD
jgi:hypothetical protein